MIKRIFVVAVTLAGFLALAAFVAYLRNATPVVPAISSVEAANPSKPYVVKLHAQWCPVCMLTKPMWSEIQATYGTRANLVVFDFTDQETTEWSRREAGRLGLAGFFAENVGWTGTVAVLDGRTKDVTASIHGSRHFDDYRVAIDAALRAAAK